MSVYAYNNEDFGPDSLLGRASDHEVVLTRTLHETLVERLTPSLLAHQKLRPRYILPQRYWDFDLSWPGRRWRSPPKLQSGVPASLMRRFRTRRGSAGGGIDKIRVYRCRPASSRRHSSRCQGASTRGPALLRRENSRGWTK